ncbi:hypothetical protein HGRIS_011200 [Hohenbuehelia grisea]|uniref:Uncharacterized protein n=1 Tax=Hohenbuehelia grisea TaxID=104357 RepID=A0ABR3JVS5_9AGAR
MHKALLVNEIVFRILGSIADDPPSSYNRGYTTRRTALHLGRTCRTMMDPAMDVVWEGVRDFSVLFRLLPADSWQANAAGGVTIIRTVTKAGNVSSIMGPRTTAILPCNRSLAFLSLRDQFLEVEYHTSHTSPTETAHLASKL